MGPAGWSVVAGLACAVGGGLIVWAVKPARVDMRQSLARGIRIPHPWERGSCPALMGQVGWGMVCPGCGSSDRFDCVLSRDG